MEIHIEKCSAWCGNLRTIQDWQQWALANIDYQDTADLPALKEIPAMQRRRLSKFAKLTMRCVLEVVADEQSDLPCIFSSRHGDLHKTSKLIEDVAQKNDLSPTHFGLSVHNAVAGLYSILANNKQPMSATSAGEDSLLMALVDGYAKLKSQQLDKILVVYTDEIVPEKYSAYVSAAEKTISVALVLTQQKSAQNFTLNFKPQCHDINVKSQLNSFQPLEFLAFLFGKKTQTSINSSRYEWALSKV